MGGRGQFKVSSDDGWSGLGGYMNAKVRKLDQQFEDKQNVEQVSSLFKDISIYVTGYTIPTANELKMLMAQHGGKFHLYYSSSRTTHVIAANLPRAKIKGLRPSQKVVRPEWLTDSIKANDVLSIHSYIVAAAGAVKGQKLLSGFTPQNKTASNSEESSSSSVHCDVTVPNQMAPETSDSACDTTNELQAQKQIGTPKASAKIPSTTSDKFLSDFYAHSRLHFLSTWKTELAEYVRSLSRVDVELTGRQELLQFTTLTQAPRQQASTTKYVMHVDMDCFFVSVGLLERPHLLGRPVAVTHHSANTPSVTKKRTGTDSNYEMHHYRMRGRQNNTEKQDEEEEEETVESIDVSPVEHDGEKFVPSYSEIASCNYEARSCGLKNGMFYGKAKELCPDLVAIPYDFDAYRDASRKLYAILTSYTRDLEAVSCDEALLDVSELVSVTGIDPLTIAEHIRNKIREATGCNASAGIGVNITLARMATRHAKPNGQYEVTHDQALSFIRDHSVKDLPGVGYVTANRLLELGAPTCGDLQIISLNVLKKEFGVKSGQKLYELCRGIDKRQVCQSKERKSVSADVNYGIRLTTIEETKTFLSNLAKEVSERLNKAHVIGKKVTLKVMIRRPDAPQETAKYGGHGVCQTLTRSKNLDSNTSDCDVIAREATSLMTSLKVAPSDLRGIGIQITQLTSIENERSKTTMEQFIESRPGTSRAAQNVVNDGAGCSSNRADVTSTSPEQPRDAPYQSEAVNSDMDFEKGFLDALPDDIRREVEQNILAQKMALQRPNSTHHVTSIRSNSPPRPSNTTKSSKRGRPRGGRNNSSRNSKKSRRSSKGSGSKPDAEKNASKRITDLFKVVGRTRTDEKGDADMTSQSSRSDVSDAVNVHSVPEFNIDELTDEPPALPPPPSLGGATTTEGARDAIRCWFHEFSNRVPLESDVEEVAQFLKRLTVESRDLECVDLVMRTFRRCVLTSLPADREAMLSWFDAYEYVTDHVQEAVRQMYGKFSLKILPIKSQER